jgi:hypothetical protein
MAKVYIIYYSTYGHIKTMAEAVKKVWWNEMPARSCLCGCGCGFAMGLPKGFAPGSGPPPATASPMDK